MDSSSLPLEGIFRLLPDVAELEDLRQSLLSRASRDPTKEWSRAGIYSTLDKRLLDGADVRQAIDETAASAVEQAERLHAVCGQVCEAALAGDEAGAARALIDLAEADERNGRFARASSILDAALSLSLPFHDKGLQLLALRRIARVLRGRGDLSEALLYYDRSRELASATGDTYGEVVALIGAGTVMSLQGKWALAEESSTAALGLLTREPGAHLLELGQVYNNLGAMATRLGRFGDAEGRFALATELWARVDSPHDLAVCRYNLGILRARQGRPGAAMEMYEHALALGIPAAFRTVIAIELAQLYAEQGDSTAAQDWAWEAEKQAIASRSPYALGNMYLGLGKIARLTDQEAGFVFHEKALEIARRTSLSLLEAETLLDYGLLRQQIGETDEASNYLKRAREIFIQLGMDQEAAVAGGAITEIVGQSPI
jgi:tetratricopeptide (TPR) repeat protein